MRNKRPLISELERRDFCGLDDAVVPCGKTGKRGSKPLKRLPRGRKKVLSLVLCVAMMLSVMVMGAGAAFTDQDKIVNEEAVDMISALGIVDGYEDDSFQPEKNIERGEAAKMIAVMLNGGKDAIQDATGSSFNDVLGGADAWANKYIEYCASEKIVAGVGGDRFAPASNVTGTQLAKMLLVSLGYDPIKEGYQNDNTWAVDVNTDAVKAGLFEGIENVDMSAALTRDNAAQMIWNALNAKTVYYLTSSTGAIVTGQTLLAKVYGGAEVLEGIMTDVSYNKDNGVYTYTIGNSSVKSTTDYTDLFAMNVTFIKDGGDALNIFASKSAVVVEGVWGDVDYTAGKTTLTVDGQKYGIDNVKGSTDLKIVAYNDYSNKYASYALDQYAFRAIDTDNGGDIDTIVVYPYVVLKTDNVKADSFDVHQLAASDAYLVATSGQSASMVDRLNKVGNNVDRDDVIVNGDIAIDGYVKAVPACYTATGMDTYTVLTAQTGTVTKAAASDKVITFGDTQYEGALLSPLDSVKHISVGSSYSFIEVNGYLFIVEGAGIVPAATNYVVATAVEESANKDGMYETDLLCSNGETKTVEAKVVDGANPNAYVGVMYTYAVDKNGNYLLTRVVDGTKGAAQTVFDVQDVYNAAGGRLTADAKFQGQAGQFVFNAKGDPCIKNTLVEDDAVVFAFIDRDQATGDLRSDEYVVLKGSDLKLLKDSGITLNWAFTGETTKSQNVSTIDMAYVYMNGDLFDTSAYAYIVNGSVRYDGHYVSLDVKTGDGDKTLTTASYLDQKVLKPLYDNLEAAKDTTVKVILDKDGKLVGYTPVTMTAQGTVSAYNETSGFITINGSNFLIDEDTVIINVNGNKLQTGITVDAFGTVNETLDLLVIR